MSETLNTENEAAADTAEGTRDAWDEIARGYDEFVTPTHMWLANEGLRRVGLNSGMRFLDVAAGRLTRQDGMSWLGHNSPVSKC